MVTIINEGNRIDESQTLLATIKGLKNRQVLGLGYF